ncbi:anaerobic selenocysteine-containing dehydrogenase [Mycobacterium sp. URHB0021]
MREVAAEWAPERVARVTGIDADRIRTLARELAGTERAVVYGRIGTCNQEFGSLASWLVDVVNILTGHFDVPGGSMFPLPTAWSVTVQPIPGLEDGAPEFGRYRTRVRGAKEVLGQVPVSCLAEEISTPGEGQIKALITVTGNPVLSTHVGHKLDEALPTLDAMIWVDCGSTRRPVIPTSSCRAPRRWSSRTTTTSSSTSPSTASRTIRLPCSPGPIPRLRRSGRS